MSKVLPAAALEDCPEGLGLPGVRVLVLVRIRGPGRNGRDALEDRGRATHILARAVLDLEESNNGLRKALQLIRRSEDEGLEGRRAQEGVALRPAAACAS